ncbi:GtrA family protein [bacterium]|nr:GtrA family protein [bacterium]
MGESGLRRILTRHREKILYLIVGGWNTVFGYAVYLGLIALIGTDHYWWLLIPTNIIGVTQNFFAYKLIVFRTKGRWASEYGKFWIVYLPYLGANLLLLPALVAWLELDPRIAQGVYAVLAVVITYLGHKYFTFREPAESIAPDQMS